MTISDPAAIYFWRPATWLRVRGPDASAFLQGQHTNDLGRLQASPAVYGLWLNQKAKVLADSFVLRGSGAEEFWVGSYFCAAPVILARLESYLIADDVTIADESADWFGATLVGTASTQAPSGAGDAILFPGRRGFKEQLECMTRSPLGIAEIKTLTAHEMELVRIRAGIPAIPVDIGPGELPNEGGLETDAISYTKGCYLGQEVIARLKSLGQVRRRLLRVAGTGVPPTQPTKLYQGTRQVGELRSVAPENDGFIGFALFTLLHLQRDIALSLGPDLPPTLTLIDPP